MHLAKFIRENRDAIVAEWEREARQISRARDLERPALLQHVPEILDDLARSIAEEGAPPPSSLGRDADAHAVERFEQGFLLSHLIREYAMLRSCVLRLWRAGHPTLSVDH